MTIQSQAEATDINRIVKRWINGGELPIGSNRQPMYGDFTDAGDFFSAQLKVKEAETQFDALPAAVRAACNHDPGQFLEMVADESRRDELIELGLVEAQLPLPLQEPRQEPGQKPQTETPPSPAGSTPGGSEATGGAQTSPASVPKNGP